MFDFSIFSTADAWISLLTLTFLEIVLGVDNIIFISIVAGKLPQNQQKKARNLGLMLALIFRIGLLLSITWIIGLTQPLFTLPFESVFANMGLLHPEEAAAISGRDLILLIGGFFLLAKSTTEIHSKVEGRHDEKSIAAKAAFGAVIAQIVMVDIIFSFDSILTAVGLTQHVLVMILAVIIAMLVMMQFSGPISHVINKHPTLQVLALSFLIMIGLTLILEGFALHVSKGFVYVAVLFSLGVEMLNIRLRKKTGAA
jgi:predicted tellurium resistance membrane protein TerC